MTEDGDPGLRRVIVDGEIDLAAATQLQARLADAGQDAGGVVIVDLSECLFIDSRGLSTLLNAARRLTRSRGALAVVCPNATPRRVFEITGTVDTLNVAATDHEACAMALAWRERLARSASSA
ncbi:MAG: STAS domain-containing protein [Thermoleophilaceae bacterium]|jgi:anti-sigma B factor antagonist